MLLNVNNNTFHLLRNTKQIFNDLLRDVLLFVTLVSNSVTVNVNVIGLRLLSFHNKYIQHGSISCANPFNLNQKQLRQ